MYFVLIEENGKLLVEEYLVNKSEIYIPDGVVGSSKITFFVFI